MNTEHDPQWGSVFTKLFSYSKCYIRLADVCLFFACAKCIALTHFTHFLLFRQFNVPTVQYSAIPMFRQFNVLTAQCSNIPMFRHPNVPTVQRSASSMFRHPIVPTVQCSDSPMFRHPYVPTAQWSDTSLFRQPQCISVLPDDKTRYTTLSNYPDRVPTSPGN